MKYLLGKYTFLILGLSMISCSYFPEDFDRSVLPAMSETNKYIKIGNDANAGLIFYPGGLVDPAAYVDFLEQLTTDDLVVFILKVPYNLAILDIDHAEGVRKSFPEIKEWSIMGHSLGGSVACFDVNNNIELYKNLILLAAYPAENVDLTGYSGRLVSLVGTRDKVIDKDRFIASQGQFSNVEVVKELDATVFAENGSYFYEIEGGNHAHFGNYGSQNGDGEASISREEQQSVLIEIVNRIL